MRKKKKKTKGVVMSNVRTKELLKLLKMTQEEVFKYVREEANKASLQSISCVEDKYIYCKSTPLNTKKPLLTSHMDTVDDHLDIRKEPNFTIDDKGTIKVVGKDTVLGADDRAGVWLMLQLMRDPEVAFDYDYVFCCNEEVGGKGSQVFADNFKQVLEDYSCFISLDRANTNDVATYGYDNRDLINIFEGIGFKEAYGSFTDCVNMSMVTSKACVNLSVGYFNEHTNNEIQDLTTLYNLLQVLKSEDLRLSLIGSFEATVNVYNYRGAYDDIYGEAPQDPVLCGCCGQHLPLYEAYDGELVCHDCFEYYSWDAMGNDY
jgi:hypothetical protein